MHNLLSLALLWLVLSLAFIAIAWVGYLTFTAWASRRQDKQWRKLCDQTRRRMEARR